MAIDRAKVQDWLDRYVAAWKSYDPAAIGDLFSEDAEYRYHPWDEPEVGRDTIVSDWVAPEGKPEQRDAEGTYDASYSPWAIEGNRAVAVGTSDYFTDATRSTRERRYHNTFLIEFDDDGRARSFTETFLLER